MNYFLLMLHSKDQFLKLDKMTNTTIFSLTNFKF